MEFYGMIEYIVRSISVVGLVVIIWGIFLVLRDFLMDPLSDDARSRR